MKELIEELKNIFALLGVSPLWASIIVLMAVVVIYFAKRYFDQKSKLKELEAKYSIEHRAKIDDRLMEYAPAQIKALLEAYRMLYESEIAQTSKGPGFSKIIEDADKMIMRPFTDFSAYLDDSIKSCIYAIHGVLEQFKYDPSEKAIPVFEAYKDTFYNDLIQVAIKRINQSVKVSGD